MRIAKGEGSEGSRRWRCIIDRVLIDQMLEAVHRGQTRLTRTTDALNSANVLYAIAGEQAVARWIKQVDPSAVRNSPTIELIVDRASVSRAHAAMLRAGFSPRADDHRYFAEPRAKPRDAVAFAVAETKPLITEIDGYRVLSLIPLVEALLTLHRLIDRVALRDLIDVGLVDQSWTARFPRELSDRLQDLIDSPDG
jgi:hypothetical protein